MPIISIKLAKGRSLEDKRKLVKAVSDSVVSTLDVKPEWVSVIIEEIDAPGPLGYARLPLSSTIS